MESKLFNYLIKLTIIELLFIAKVKLNNLPEICKSDEDLSRESRYLIQEDQGEIIYGQGTLYLVRDFVNITYEDISTVTTCDGIKEMSMRMSCRRSRFYPDSILSVCPYYFRKNIDENRIPRVLVEAKCACTSCIENHGMSSNLSGQRTRCKENYSYTLVLRKRGNEDYMRVVEPVAKSCSCVRSPPARRRQRCYHMPLN